MTGGSKSSLHLEGHSKTGIPGLPAVIITNITNRKARRMIWTRQERVIET